MAELLQYYGRITAVLYVKYSSNPGRITTVLYVKYSSNQIKAERPRLYSLYPQVARDCY